MQHLEERYGWLHSPQAYISLKHEGDKVIVFERGVYPIFCCSNTRVFCGFSTFILRIGTACQEASDCSFTDYRVGVDVPGTYRVVLDSDSKAFDGQGRIDPACRYFTNNLPWNNRSGFLQGMNDRESELRLVYIPSRVAIVLAKDE